MAFGFLAAACRFRLACELEGCLVSALLGQNSFKEFDPSPAVLSGAF